MDARRTKTGEAVERMKASEGASADDLRTALETVTRQRDSLKAAGDAVVFALSHPTRDGRRLMSAIVDYRRVSDEVETGGSPQGQES